MLEITEIIRRAEQGRTEPFLCGASDGRQYFVKGRAATASGLMRECLGANLVKRFGLPVPSMPSFRQDAGIQRPGMASLELPQILNQALAKIASYRPWHWIPASCRNDGVY